METKKQTEQWLREQGFEKADREWERVSYPIHVRVWFVDDQNVTVMVGRLSEEDWGVMSWDLNKTGVREGVVKTIEGYCLSRAHFLQAAQALKDCLDKGINYREVEDLSKKEIGNP